MQVLDTSYVCVYQTFIHQMMIEHTSYMLYARIWTFVTDSNVR